MEQENNRTDICNICNKSKASDDVSIWFIGIDKRTRTICSDCAKQLDELENENNPIAAQAKITELKNKLTGIADIEIRKQLRDLIAEKEPLFVKNEPNYSFDSSIWISGLRLVSFIAFFSIILAGFVLGIMSQSVGLFFISLIVSFIIAFLLVSGIMISLDKATDLRIIKNELLKRKT